MTDTPTQLSAEPTAASVRLPIVEQPTRLSPDVMANEAGALRTEVVVVSEQVAVVSERVAEAHGDSLRIQLEARTDEAAKRSPVDLLSELADLGFSWTSIARSVGISIPALRKWRNGESVTGANRRKLARLVALVGVLENDHLISDVASWLDIPLAASGFTGIDVLEAGHFEDVVEHGAQHLGASELLDRTLPGWRDSIDDRFEVYEAADGERGIRMRSDDGT